MKRRPTLLINVLAYASIYPVLAFILALTVGCSLLFSLLLPKDTLDNKAQHAPRRAWNLVVLPTPPAATAAANVFVLAEDTVTQLPETQIPAPPAGDSDVSAIAAPQIYNDDAGNPMNIPPTAAPPAPVQNNTQASASENSAPLQNSAADSSGATAPSPDINPATATPTIALNFSGFTENPRPTATRIRRPAATPTPEGIFEEIVSSLRNAISDAPDDAKGPVMLVNLPTLTPTPTETPTLPPTYTATPTETPLPTQTPAPTATPLPTNTPLPTSTPASTNTPTATAVSIPTDTPTPTLTPLPEYDYMLAEFFNSPTTNPFLVMYVAVVDPNEVPIGDMKIVGTRLDHNLTYESPLSKWHYEGYSAPGEVVKSGNVKFEPPGGIENVSWILHLEDAHGNRMSDDIPFHTNPDDKQWYFIKFRRKF